MEADMAKYLFEVSYTAQGAKGLLEGGGGKRRAAAEQAAKSVGGKIESFYFAFGDADAFVIADVPDHASASAISLAVSASGGAHCKTIILMTPDEVDQEDKNVSESRGRRLQALFWPDWRLSAPAIRNKPRKSWPAASPPRWLPSF